MKLLILSVADHAYIDNATRKLYILGAFNQIAATKEPAFPLVLNVMSLVIKLGAEISEIGEHLLTIALSNDDGKEIFRLEQYFLISKAIGGLASEFNVILEIRDAVFPAAGEYQINIEVDRHYLDSTAIIVTNMLRQES